MIGGFAIGTLRLGISFHFSYFFPLCKLTKYLPAREKEHVLKPMQTW
jgi:hypothetical protein